MRLSPLSVLDVLIGNMTSPDLKEPGYDMIVDVTRRAPSRTDPSNVYSYNKEDGQHNATNKTEYYISEKYSYDYERLTPIKSEDSDKRQIPLYENRRPYHGFTRTNDFYTLPPTHNNDRIHHVMPYKNHGIHRYPPPSWESHPYRRPPPPPPQYRHPPPQYREISFYDERQTMVLPGYNKLQYRMPHPPSYRRPPPSYQRRWPPPTSDRGGPIYDGSPPLLPQWHKGPRPPFSGEETLSKSYADRVFDFETPPSISSSPRRDTQSQQYSKSNDDLSKTQPPLKNNPENKLRPVIDLNITRSMEQSPGLIAKKHEDNQSKQNFNKFDSNTKANHGIEEDDVQSIIDVGFSNDINYKILNHNITSVKSKEVSQQPPVYSLLPNFFQVVPVTPKS
ncbi:extensin-2-like isoform X1 [Manduca sexta]|uniref:Uncharacterized protein n=1 Tax=Manduca sexta TaxID=7130 RepID=A0A922D0F9_MANSE|nr:extensin-2-like isoform X1 [Manduca sexta]KAG6464947.1 hypothetical protein O3G_MSEX014829 [Manduca sexta]